MVKDVPGISVSLCGADRCRCIARQSRRRGYVESFVDGRDNGDVMNLPIPKVPEKGEL